MVSKYHGNKIPFSLLKMAKGKIKYSAITPYVMLVLNKIVENIFLQKCSAVDPKKLLKIIQAASHNPYLMHRPFYLAVLLHLEAGIMLQQHHLDKSLQLLEQSFKLYPARLFPLIQKAYLELQNKMYAEAEQTLNLIHENSNSLSVPKDQIMQLENAFYRIEKE